MKTVATLASLLSLMAVTALSSLEAERAIVELSGRSHEG